MDESRYLPMKAWAEDEQPRERLLQQGAVALSLNELFAILLRSGVGGESALDLARRILADCHNDLNELARCGVRELMNKYKGVGLAKAASIVAAMEIGRRRRMEMAAASPVVTCSRDAYEYVKSFIADLDHEEFWVVGLAVSGRIKGCECVSAGGIDGTVVDVRVLFRRVLEMKAANMIVAHNHPGGGEMRPSRQDEQVTRKIHEAGKLLDINLFDHIIVGVNHYYSFADEGKIG